MGVKGFAAWLAAEYPGAFVYGDPPTPPRRDFASRQSAGFVTAARAGGGEGGGRGASSASPPPPASFDHVYVDMAGVLHTALRQGGREVAVGGRVGEGGQQAMPHTRKNKTNVEHMGAGTARRRPAPECSAPRPVGMQ